MFETRKMKVASRKAFAKRFGLYFLYSSMIVAFSLIIGTTGYHYCEELPWIDAFVNASMILTGMGPVDKMCTVPGKLFTSFYALYSGVAFLSTIAVFLAPVLHRFLHLLNLDE